MDSVQEKELFVPGRLCILGEHSDWAGEYRDTNGSIPYGTIYMVLFVE
jgi:galactokinase